jgi:uncharacterized protein YegL
MKLISKNAVSLAEKKQTVKVELTSSESREISSNNIPPLPLDLVMVLDITRSMEGKKLAIMKTAMFSLIEKLTHVVRLSIVTFGTDVKRQCGLCHVTKICQKELKDLINSFEANGNTNASHGLQMGLQILKDRWISIGRPTGIMLVSGSNNSTDRTGADAQVSIGDVRVHAFGLGEDYDRMVLKDYIFSKILCIGSY